MNSEGNADRFPTTDHRSPKVFKKPKVNKWTQWKRWMNSNHLFPCLSLRSMFDDGYRKVALSYYHMQKNKKQYLRQSICISRLVLIFFFALLSTKFHLVVQGKYSHVLQHFIKILFSFPFLPLLLLPFLSSHLSPHSNWIQIVYRRK